MADTLAYHVGSNVPGYSPEGDVTCWDTVAEARDALWTLMAAHNDHLADVCDCADIDPECDDCDVYDVADKLTTETFRDHPLHWAGWEQGLTVQLLTGRELPLTFWIEPVTMDHVAECKPLSK